MNQFKKSQEKLIFDYQKLEKLYRETNEKKDSKIAHLNKKVDLLKLQGLDTQLEEYIEIIKRKGII